MELAEIEKIFLDKLESIDSINLSVSRNEYGVFSISVESPCEEIGYLKAYVQEGEITLTCKVSHTHFEASYFRRLGELDPIKAMIENAAKSFRDFLNDETYVSNTTTEDGRSVCSGWGSIGTAGDSAKRLETILRRQHKSPIKTEYWVWSGKYENL